MSNHPIDDLFANQLREHGLKPEKATWEELQRRMNAKETQRSSFVWWYASAASVSVVLLATWWIWSDNESDGKNSTSSPIAQQITKREQPNKVGVESGLRIADIEPAVEPKTAHKKPVDVQDRVAKHPHQPGKKIEELPRTATSVLPVISEELLTTEVRGVEERLREPERTLVVQVATPEIQADKSVATADEPQSSSRIEISEEQPRKKRFRLGRVLRQFSKLKAGEPVEWEEVGIQPGVLMARASEKVQEGKEKISDSYDNLRQNTFRKNSSNK
ncbi:hypothetical protein ACFQ4C_22190 [Larkinella insperata]|uniref:Uncharacterized protein n=1 Tax=Larkinella insperata TaxID=332158 RepID=A0ABW3Q8Z1_9BACT|nr:hypothetical protein [Larkinella insperata]